MTERLSQISTAWTQVFVAHTGDEPGTEELVKQARRDLLQRYGTAVYRYLLAGVKDADVADELFQDFSLRLVRGDFKRAHPDKGRFRAYLITSLSRMIMDYHRGKSGKKMLPLPEEGPADMAKLPELFECEKEFKAAWCKELLDRTWDALKRWEEATGQLLYTVLRLRTDHPETQSPAIAKQLSTQLNQPISAVTVRKRLYQARQKFVELLVADVRQTLDNPDDEQLQEELIDVGLWKYVSERFQRTDD